MIAQIFNSSLISGPETLVLPNLSHLRRPSCVIWLREERKADDKNDSARKYFQSFAEVHEIPVRSRSDSSAAKSLRETLIRIGATVAHAHDVKATFLLDRAGAHDRYRRLSTHHGVHARSGFRQRAYEQYYSRFLLPRMDRALVVCSSDLEILIRRGLERDKVRLHLNGVDRPQIAPETRPQRQLELRTAWGISTQPDEKIFGIVARLDHEKDHAKALRIFAACRDLPFRVICFGSGPLREALEKQTRELALEKKVIWGGYRANLGSELVGFDGLLSFSKAEGLPINLIEAGWAATPVFARAVDGVSDLIPSERFGMTFEANLDETQVANLFRRFVSTDQQAPATNLQERVVTTFSGRSWARRFDEILDEVLADSAAEI